MNVVPNGQAAAGRPGATQDFWDVGTGDLSAQMPVQEFSELVEVDAAAAGGNKIAVYVLLAVILGGSGWFLYESLVNGGDPIAKLTSIYDELTGSSPVDAIADTAGSEPPPATAVPEAPVTDAVRADSPAPAKPSATPPRVVAGNPYWVLPNGMVGLKRPMSRPWAPEEEETFRAGLAHSFTYQRFKTVMDVRQRRLYGSDAILWDAMQDKKFWTRMYAAVGLAEFNVEVSLSAFEGALTGARSELIADFFERFVRRPSAAQAFVLRQVVRLLDEKGRLVVLQGINRAPDRLRDLYLVAASRDPGRRVQTWATKALRARGLSAARYDELLAVVDGRVDGTYLLRGGKGAKVPGSGKAAKPSAVQPVDADMPSSVATEEDIERELQQFERSGGDVEFYEPGAETESPAPSDLPDPETFEYDE